MCDFGLSVHKMCLKYSLKKETRNVLSVPLTVIWRLGVYERLNGHRRYGLWPIHQCTTNCDSLKELSEVEMLIFRH